MKEFQKDQPQVEQRLTPGRSQLPPPLQLSASEENKDGPGKWVKTTESMSDRSKAYQSRITGKPWNVSYEYNDVKFDGYKDGTLIECKAGHENFVSNGRFQPWFKGLHGMVSQTFRQSKAAEGIPLEWNFEKEEVMDAYINDVNPPSNITPVHTP